MILQLGFRNLLRNKRRTILAGMAVGLGLASLIIGDGFWKGMVENMITNITSTYLGHAQIHNPQFQDTYETEFYLKNENKILDTLKKQKMVKAVTARTMSPGMLSSTKDSLNVQVIGIEPEHERKISKFHNRMLEGHYIESDKDLVIGVGLKEKLEVELGDRIVLTVTEVGTGEIKQELFRLSGVYGMGIKEMDEGMILLHFKQLQKLLNISGAHELAISLSEEFSIEEQMATLKQVLPRDIKLESWKELTPQIVAAIDMSNYSMGIMSAILFALVALGVLNTMFMSLFERIYEFGVLRAVGTKIAQIILMILAEAFALSLVAVFFGAIIAIVIGSLMAHYGIDYSGITFGEITFTEKIYYIFTFEQYILYPLILIIFTVLISIYPAIHITRIRPAEALHRSL